MGKYKSTSEVHFPIPSIGKQWGLINTSAQGKNLGEFLALLGGELDKKLMEPC